MKVNYYYSESNTRPLDIEITTSKKYVYIRRNIKEVLVEREEEGEPYKKFVYEEAAITKDQFESYKNEILYKLLNNEDNTALYDKFLDDLNTPVEYTNGHSYKPKWADAIYYGLLQKGVVWPELFPMRIYDSTGEEENVVEMTYQDLRDLALFLEQKREEAFLAYKKASKEENNSAF